MGFMDTPAVPPELRSISPYVQRADELYTKDPVMSYWCAYYAAQVGITLKPKAPASKTYLISLLDALERMKSAIGDNDAVHDESAASAYVENFALKVFAMADNDDRRGEATRGTAKKFLAAANFLEILRTFNQDKPDAVSPTPDSAEEKIRYAKWKAADIAKAFREGRKPTPGPAVSEPEVALPLESPPVGVPSLTRTTSPPPPIIDLPGPPRDEFFQQQLPPHVSDELLAHTLPGGSSFVQSPSWSTAATPGTPGLSFDSAVSRSAPRKAWVSSELEGRSDGSITPVDELPIRDEAMFTPSVADAATPSTNLSPGLHPDVEFADTLPGPSAPPLDDSPPEFVPPTALASVDEAFDIDRTRPPGHLPIPPPSPTYSDSALRLSEDVYDIAPASSTVLAQPPAPIAPILGVSVTRPPASVVTPAARVSATPALPRPILNATATAVPIELTPQVIARVQKHCRFAISALDYEDAEQARKELRTALQMLGG